MAVFFFGKRPIDSYIECDGSLNGWGASCSGQSVNGQWLILEAHNHINSLELLGALYALQAFVSNLRDAHVRLKLDNSTAVAYINKMAGIKSPSLNSLSRTLWEWCDEMSIIISAQHIPGKENLVADSSSRQFSSNLEWSVIIDNFNQISNMTFAPVIDLLASDIDLLASASHCSSMDNSKLVSPAPPLLSGDRLQTEAFLMMQPQPSVHLGPLGLKNSTTQPRRNGVDGASKGKWIYFRDLSMK